MALTDFPARKFALLAIVNFRFLLSISRNAVILQAIQLAHYDSSRAYPRRA